MPAGNSRPPTSQGVSSILRRAGFEKAVITNNSRHCKENTAGFHVHRLAGQIIVNYWPTSTPPSTHTTAAAAAQRRLELEMLQRYADVIGAAGWRVKVTALRTVTVDTPLEA